MGGLQTGGGGYISLLKKKRRQNKVTRETLSPEADLVACLGSEFYVCFVRVIAVLFRSMKKPILRDIYVKK